MSRGRSRDAQSEVAMEGAHGTANFGVVRATEGTDGVISGALTQQPQVPLAAAAAAASVAAAAAQVLSLGGSKEYPDVDPASAAAAATAAGAATAVGAAGVLESLPLHTAVSFSFSNQSSLGPGEMDSLEGLVAAAAVEALEAAVMASGGNPLHNPPPVIPPPSSFIPVAITTASEEVAAISASAPIQASLSAPVPVAGMPPLWQAQASSGSSLPAEVQHMEGWNNLSAEVSAGFQLFLEIPSHL